MYKERIKSWHNRTLIGILIIALILSLLPVGVRGASNATNGTYFNQTTSSWVERVNLSLTTADTGNVFVVATLESRTNFSTARAGVRLAIDGVEITRVNLTEFTYQFNIPVVGYKNINSGAHYVTLETSAPSGYKLYVSNWTLFAYDLSGGGGSNISSVSAVSPLTSSGTTTVQIFDNRTAYPNSSLTSANFNAWNSTSNTTTDAVNIQQNISISNLQNVDTAQNRSFQNGSFAFVLTNGTNAIATGYYPGEPEIPDSITIDRLSLQGVTGAMNVSLLYSATSSPTYPANSVATISSATTLTGLSISAVQYSNMSVYVINNTGNVNKTTLRVHYRRVIQ